MKNINLKESFRRFRPIAKRLAVVWRNASSVQKAAIALLLLGCVFYDSDNNSDNNKQD